MKIGNTEYCDACRLFPAYWSNAAILASKDKLCKRCYEDWYEYAVVHKNVLASRRQKEVEEYYKP